jgi:hypothetical protein
MYIVNSANCCYNLLISWLLFTQFQIHDCNKPIKMYLNHKSINFFFIFQINILQACGLKANLTLKDVDKLEAPL